MSKVLLRVAQIVGVLILAGIAISVVVGLVQWVLGIAIIVAIPVGGYLLYKKLKGSDGSPQLPGAQKALPKGTGDRRSELESRAVMDPSGRCGWCGAAELHKDEYGFPTTPLRYHRAEIDAML
jgi:hypothetical protein